MVFQLYSPVPVIVRCLPPIACVSQSSLCSAAARRALSESLALTISSTWQIYLDLITWVWTLLWGLRQGNAITNVLYFWKGTCDLLMLDKARSLPFNAHILCNIYSALLYTPVNPLCLGELWNQTSVSSYCIWLVCDWWFFLHHHVIN